ncbi:zinc transporter 2 [Caerostris extrusa]|uniref:Zinc transporter 2 n=1 Tax=Caerostris extrusa TaxID=172846 RepID=A0AAV4XJR1_CAEEX|nr:zinc transporter 2 [Caerostris extrusa]
MSSENQTSSEDMLTSHRSYVTKVHGSTQQFIPQAESMRKNDIKRLILASILCFAFMVTEIVGGILSNSLAVITDAAHLLTDFGAFLVSLTSLYIAGKKRTKTMTFGFHRAEVIGALISILSIWLLTGILLYAAIQRMISQDFEIDAKIMLIVAIIGMLANVILSLGLLCPLAKKSKGNTSQRHGMGLRSAFIHVVGDFVHTTGVLVVGILIYFVPSYKMADPIITIIFSFIVLITTLTILKDIVVILMEGVPKHISFKKIHEILFSLPQVSQVHHLRMWSLTLGKVALSAHVVIKRGENPSQVLFASISFDL